MRRSPNSSWLAAAARSIRRMLTLSCHKKCLNTPILISSLSLTKPRCQAGGDSDDSVGTVTASADPALPTLRAVPLPGRNLGGMTRATQHAMITWRPTGPVRSMTPITPVGNR